MRSKFFASLTAVATVAAMGTGSAIVLAATYAHSHHRSIHRTHHHAGHAAASGAISALQTAPAAPSAMAGSIESTVSRVTGDHFGDVRQLTDTAQGAVYAAIGDKLLCLDVHSSAGASIGCAPQGHAEDAATPLISVVTLDQGTLVTALLPDVDSNVSLALHDGTSVRLTATNNVVQAVVNQDPAALHFTTPAGPQSFSFAHSSDAASPPSK